MEGFTLSECLSSFDVVLLFVVLQQREACMRFEKSVWFFAVCVGTGILFLKKNNGFQKWKRYFEKSYEEVVSYTRYFPLCNLSSYLNIIINIIIPHNTRSYTYSVKKSWNILCSCLSRLQYVQK